MIDAALSYLAVDTAFGAFRAAYPAKGPMKAADNDDQLRLMTPVILRACMTGPAAKRLAIRLKSRAILRA